MKTLIIAALAAIGISTAASADNFDTNLLKTTLVTDNLQFSLEGTIGDEFDNLGDAWMFEAGGYFFDHTVGSMDATVYFFGRFGDAFGDEYGALGAEYILSQDFDGTALELSATATYVMFDDFDNGDLLLTPRARFEGVATDQVTLFGEAGYSWNATDDFNAVGGYVEGGVELSLTESTSLLTSVVQPFDVEDDDMFARIELVFNF